jgi:selenocysteine lyase/cysteine desulfurase
MSPIDRRGFLMTATATGLAALPAPRAARALERSADENPLGVRDDFHVTREQTYINISLVGPMPTPVHEAAIAYADAQRLNPAPAFFRSLEVKEDTRTAFAQLFGAKREEVAILFSTSDAENIVTDAIDLKAGDNVVVDELHFETTFVLYRELERTKGIQLRIVPHTGGKARLEDFDARTDDRTRLISVAWVSNRNGFRHDVKALAELAHSRKALLFADGIQALGAFPVDLHAMGVDFAAANSYKYLLSSWGAAPFYVREEHLDRIPSDRFGHNQVVEALPDFRFRLQQSAAKYEYGGLVYGTVAQLNAALGYLGGVGLDRIERHTVALAHRLRDGLAGLGFDMFTPPDHPAWIVSFNHGREPKDVQQALEAERISVSHRAGGTQIRASVGLYNNQADIDHLLRVMARLA